MGGSLELRGREVRLVRRPRGLPREQDFAVARVPVAAPSAGQIVVRNTWLSLEPSARLRMGAGGSSYLPRFELGAPLDGWAVGEVLRSESERFRPGDHVLHGSGWREYATLDADAEGERSAPVAIEVDETTTARAYLGPLGWVGLTAWVGLLDVAELRAGDVVYVSAAAGAVGCLAVQLARLRGHRVVGSAGSAEKVRWIRDALGAETAFCHRDGDVAELLARAAPEGIDLYFDNVGGDHLEAALAALRPGGRVALCGAISTYNATAAPAGPRNLFEATAKSLTLRGFLARRHAERMPAFRAEMRRLLAAGSIVYPETVADGIEAAPGAFVGMLRGANVGKTLVRV